MATNIIFARFYQAVSKVRERLASRATASKDFFFINTGKQKQRVVFDELLYVEGEGNYVRYVTKTAQYLVRSSIKATLALLPSARFVQIHRSYIVALQWIDKIEDNHVHIGSKKMAISATYREDFLRVIDSL